MILRSIEIICFKILYFLMKIFGKISKRNILLRFKEFIDQRNYFDKIILNKKIIFFTPNELVKYRVDTIFDKEPETIKWIDDFQDDSIFWDIGSNIGLYSVYAALKKEKIKIYSFEPSTSNLRTLSRNISINNLHQKISIIPFAISNLQNKFLLLREKNFTEGGALSAFGVDYDYSGKKFKFSNSYKTFGTSLNNLIRQRILEIPNYIKIDVDGIEDLILDGSNDILSNKKLKSILIEINDKFETQKNKIIQTMKDNNFDLVYKKRNDNYYKGEFEGIYNYIFKKY